MSDQNINYVVTATDTASPVFDKVDKSIAKTTGSTGKLVNATGRARITQMNFNRVIQDAPFGFIAIQNNIDPLVSSFQALRLETKSTGGAFKALLGSFAGPAGIISIISLVVSGITAYIMSAQRAKKETKELSKEFKKLGETLSFADFGSQFLESTLKLAEAQKRLSDAVGRRKPGIYLPKNYLETEVPTQMFTKKGDAEAFAKAKKEVQDLTASHKVLLDQYNKFKGIIIDIYAGDYEAKSIFKVREAIRALTLEYETAITAKDRLYLKSQIDQYNAALDKMLGKEKEIIAIRRSEIPKHMGQAWTSMWARSRVPRVLSPSGTDFKKPEITSMSEAEFRNLTIVSNAFVDTFRQNFIGAWEDAFGRANSLFEQLWQNIAGGLMDLVAQQASNAIFSFLATAITGVPVPMGKVSGGTQIVIENKLGEDTFERGVYKSYGGASQRYKKVYRG